MRVSIKGVARLLYASNLYHYGEVISCIEVPLISERFVFFLLWVSFLFFFVFLDLWFLP
jgi:hypothetical protein